MSDANDKPGTENGSCECECSNDLQLANEKIDRLEALAGYALTVERTNTREWMMGFQREVNKVLVADGDHRRCTFDGNSLRLRSIRQVSTSQ